MWITTTEAVLRLADVHLLGEAQAKRVLRAGLAGPRHRVGSAYFYENERFEELLARPRCSDEALDRWRPFIARVGRQRPLDLNATWQEQAAVMSTRWHLPLLTAFQIGARKPPTSSASTERTYGSNHRETGQPTSPAPGCRSRTARPGRSGVRR